jgi:acyl carrier protein
MNIDKLMIELETLLDVEPNTLKRETILSSLSQWDSMAKLSLIVLLSDNFKLKISSQQLNEFKTVDDILKFCKL